jgi:putative hydroxymethylpyrimidine transport system substrate-binding protein
MKKIQKWSKTILALTLAAGLAACGSQTGANPAPAPAEKASEPTELTIALDWYPNAVHSFLYAGALVRHPLNVIMTRQDSGIDSPQKLAGKNVGYPSIPLDESIVRTVVKQSGGDDSGLSFTDIGFDIVPAMTAKKVDAVVGGYINHEQLILEKNGIPVNVFKPSDFGVPDYYELVLTTSDDTLGKKQPAIEAFVRAATKGQEYVAANQEKALDLILTKQASEFPLEKDIETKSLEILVPMMDAGDKPFGSQTTESWQNLIDWMKNEKLITSDVKVEQVMRDLAK